jgi:hypothetical protein
VVTSKPSYELGYIDPNIKDTVPSTQKEASAGAWNNKDGKYQQSPVADE